MQFLNFSVFFLSLFLVQCYGYSLTDLLTDQINTPQENEMTEEEMYTKCLAFFQEELLSFLGDVKDKASDIYNSVKNGGTGGEMPAGGDTMDNMEMDPEKENKYQECAAFFKMQIEDLIVKIQRKANAVSSAIKIARRQNQRQSGTDSDNGIISRVGIPGGDSIGAGVLDSVVNSLPIENEASTDEANKFLECKDFLVAELFDFLESLKRKADLALAALKTKRKFSGNNENPFGLS